MKKLLILLLTLFSISTKAQKADSAKSNSDTILIKAQFPGGENAWNKYIQKIVENKIDVIHEDKKSRGTAEVEFIVGIDGSISKIKIVSLEGSVLAKVLYDAVLKSPLWTPATKNNIKVESVQTKKATFQIYDAKEERKERREKRKALNNQ